MGTRILDHGDESRLSRRVRKVDGHVGGIESGHGKPDAQQRHRLGVQSRNGNLQFIAGIVVGVAGAALVGVVQEGLKVRCKLKLGDQEDAA